MNKTIETAVLGGGCFWCLEAVYLNVNGVSTVRSGYAGGSVENPTYDMVCKGNTGHAEVVELIFDPQIITYEEILNIFFSIHNPTTPDRQGADVGPQYRSIILYQNEQQKITAQKIIKEIEAEKKWDAPVVTELVPLENFYEAEPYHQNYFANNPHQGYCRVVISPKVQKFRKEHPDMLNN